MEKREGGSISTGPPKKGKTTPEQVENKVRRTGIRGG